MNGPAVLFVGIFLLIIGGVRSFAAQPEPHERQTAYGRGDVIGSRILLGIGGLLLLVGAIWTVIDAFQ